MSPQPRSKAMPASSAVARLIKETKNPMFASDPLSFAVAYSVRFEKKAHAKGLITALGRPKGCKLAMGSRYMMLAYWAK